MKKKHRREAARAGAHEKARVSRDAATKSDLLKLLDRHVGWARGISAVVIAKQLGCTVRHAHALVTELRMSGIAVCEHPHVGYFLARTVEQLSHTCDILRSRAITLLTLESKLRHVPLADLLDRLRYTPQQAAAPQ